MRLGVLDVGSNTVHLLVVDARRGGHPTPMSSTKASLRLAEAIDGSGKLTRKGADKLIDTIDEFAKIAASSGCAELMAFATSAVRDAKNSEDVLARVHAETGVALQRAQRGRRVPADVPGGAPLVRLERRAASSTSTSAADRWSCPAASTRSPRWRCRCRSARAG